MFPRRMLQFRNFARRLDDQVLILHVSADYATFPQVVCVDHEGVSRIETGSSSERHETRVFECEAGEPTGSTKAWRCCTRSREPQPQKHARMVRPQLFSDPRALPAVSQRYGS